MGNQDCSVRFTAEQLQHLVEDGRDQTDWARIDAMSELDLEASIDESKEGQADWLHATTELPRPNNN